MANYDCLYLCTENRLRSKYGLETLHNNHYQLLCLIFVPKWRKVPWEAYKKRRWYHNKYFHTDLSDISSIRYCHQHAIPYFITYEENLSTITPALQAETFKFVISNAWPAKIPSEIIDLASIAAMNCHSAFLPYYRGANVTYAPLINKEKFGGLSLHVLTDEFDAGKIIKQVKFPISDHENPQSLVKKRSEYVRDLLIEGMKVAGHPDQYLANPPQPIYYTCSYPVYLKFRVLNFIRAMIKLPPLRFAPQRRYKFFEWHKGNKR